MTKISGILLIVFSFSCISISSADVYHISHQCTKPIKPNEFNADLEKDEYEVDVEAYRICLDEFVEEQYHAVEEHLQAAENHERAALAAIEEWETFVAGEQQDI